MPSLYATREQVKRAGNIWGSDKDAIIDRLLESASRRIDAATRRFFIPKTETRLYRWPPSWPYRSGFLWLDQDLLAVTTLQAKAQNSTPTTIAAADYFLEPANQKPYHRIEIDISSSSVFESGDTPQRSISVAGRWGYSEDTKAAGTVSSGLATGTTATSFVCSDGSLIDVGDSLLIESEQIFVSKRANAQVGSQTTSAALASDKSVVAVGVGDGTLFFAGGMILIDSERMLIESISSNTLTCVRAYDGSVLASHSITTAVHAFRTMTITRAVNGTTAATHANATAVSKYVPPMDVQEACVAMALAGYAQEQAHWGRSVGGGEGSFEMNGRSLKGLVEELAQSYKRVRVGAI